MNDDARFLSSSLHHFVNVALIIFSPFIPFLRRLAWLLSLVALLLKRGANHLAVDKDGKKPLEYALERENGDTVTL